MNNHLLERLELVFLKGTSRAISVISKQELRLPLVPDLPVEAPLLPENALLVGTIPRSQIVEIKYFGIACRTSFLLLFFCFRPDAAVRGGGEYIVHREEHEGRNAGKDGVEHVHVLFEVK